MKKALHNKAHQNEIQRIQILHSVNTITYSCDIGVDVQNLKATKTIHWQQLNKSRCDNMLTTIIGT